MNRETVLEAVKKAMRATNKANLTLSIGRSVYALDEKELARIEEDAIAIEALANDILKKAQEAIRRNAQMKGEWL